MKKKKDYTNNKKKSKKNRKGSSCHFAMCPRTQGAVALRCFITSLGTGSKYNGLPQIKVTSLPNVFLCYSSLAPLPAGLMQLLLSAHE